MVIVPALKEATAWRTVSVLNAEVMPIVIPTIIGVETAKQPIKSVSLPDLREMESVPPDVVKTATAPATKTAIRMVVALLVLMTLVAFRTMDPFPQDRTPFVTTEFVVIRTNVRKTEMITLAATLPLAVRTAKPTSLARLVFPTLTADPLMVVRLLDNPLAMLQLVYADLAKRIPIAPVLLLTVVLMVVVMLVLLAHLAKNAAVSMVVKFLTNLTAILLPIPVCLSVPPTTTAMMTVLLIATLNVDAA